MSFCGEVNHIHALDSETVPINECTGGCKLFLQCGKGHKMFWKITEGLRNSIENLLISSVPSPARNNDTSPTVNDVEIWKKDNFSASLR